VDNEIPLARGLGSSSAAIVAGLCTGLLWQRLQHGGSPALGAADRDRLAAAAMEIEGHPDNVAPAVLGDLVICGTDGGRLITIGERWPERLAFVAVIPDLRVRTADARQALPESIPHADAVANGGRLARLLGCLRSERFEHLRGALQDALHQPYRLPLARGAEEALSALASAPGSVGAYLSGSGPTLMALCLDRPDLVGRAGVRAFADRGIQAHARTLAVDRTGATLLPPR
jgi:homoserine kinase